MFIMMNTLTILLLMVLQSSAKLLIPDLNVTITSLTKCQSNEEYPVEVYNVLVNLDRGKIKITGTLTTLLDLTPPIKTILKIEKDEFGAWIEVPCVNNIGSCTYDDLCIHSIPSNETCPENFVDNNVPCRCPIPKGNYTIPSSFQHQLDLNSYFSIYSGKYWARAIVLHGNTNLSCYEVYFTIQNAEIDYTNNIDRISVILI